MFVRHIVAGLALAIAFVSAAAVPSARAEDNFYVRFSWKLKGEYAPFYLARERGLFTKAGLAVHLGEGAGSEAALGALIQGQEDVVVIPGIYALTAVSKGMLVKIVALYQPRAPVAIISFPDRPIRTPQDLVDKSLVGTVGDTTTDYLKVFCRMNKIDCGKIKLVMLNNQARLPQFMSRQVDALSTYWNIDVPQLEFTSKQKFVVMDVAKYGLVEPGLSVVASNTEIEKQPERLKSFISALSQGFGETKANPDAAAKVLLQAWQGGPNLEVVETQVKLSNDTFVQNPGKPLGWVDDGVITAALNLLHESRQIAEVKPHGEYYVNTLLGE
ncbi:MAG TPA: ABC transporter substrate-binding protein [Stellaceae bacterium]|nr:ABC transporter substrate-binding protein [Stellaceae bacterium]